MPPRGGGAGGNAKGRVEYIKRVPKFLQAFYDQHPDLKGTDVNAKRDPAGDTTTPKIDQDDTWREIDAAQVLYPDEGDEIGRVTKDELSRLRGTAAGQPCQRDGGSSRDRSRSPDRTGNLEPPKPCEPPPGIKFRRPPQRQTTPTPKLKVKNAAAGNVSFDFETEEGDE